MTKTEAFQRLQHVYKGITETTICGSVVFGMNDGSLERQEENGRRVRVTPAELDEEVYSIVLIRCREFERAFEELYKADGDLSPEDQKSADQMREEIALIAEASLEKLRIAKEALGKWEPRTPVFDLYSEPEIERLIHAHR